MNARVSCTEWKAPLAHWLLFKRSPTLFNRIATEAYAVFRHILPASLVWVCRKHITGEIRTIAIQVTVNKVSKSAYLNIHGKGQVTKGQEVSPILLSHGDYSHPCSLLHLADSAQNDGFSVFSLYMPGVENIEEFDGHNFLLKAAIDKIESIVHEGGGKFAGILGVGHSKGAILLAHRQFVDLDARIKSTCSIAGRLNAPEDKDCPNASLRNIVKRIYAGIFKNAGLTIVQIIPKDDWNASYESMAVRPQNECHTVPGQHLSGLYSDETGKYFTGFLKKFSNL